MSRSRMREYTGTRRIPSNSRNVSSRPSPNSSIKKQKTRNKTPACPSQNSRPNAGVKSGILACQNGALSLFRGQAPAVFSFSLAGFSDQVPRDEVAIASITFLRPATVEPLPVFIEQFTSQQARGFPDSQSP